MASSGQLTSSALRALQDGKLAGSWVLDASRSEVRLKSTSVWGLVPVRGIFRQVTGNGTVSAAGDATGTITVAARSVDTKNNRRDEHLRSADFFDATVSSADGEVTLDGQVQVNRADFGLTWNRMGTSMHNTITVHAVFTRL